MGYDYLKKCSKRRSEMFVGFRKSSFGEHKIRGELPTAVLIPIIRVFSPRAESRALNPRFWMPHFGQKTGFRARMNEIKSGIPCSG